MSANKPTDQEFERFKNKIKPLINLDLSQYKSKQMERRILSFMNRSKIPNLDTFSSSLKDNPDLLRDFINMLTINVSEFFRDQKRFEEFESLYLDDINKNASGRMKIWSAGCSIGAEIYTIAMILDKRKMLNSSTLIATDFDSKILDKAKEGIYNKTEYKTVKTEYQEYFEQIDPDKYQIISKIRNKVKFVRQDLLKDTFDKNFNLILCRNVVIYFTEEAKDLLYKKFYDSLANNGVLFVGSTERIQNYREIGYNLKTHFFYQKSL